jgi:hypothetical protein
MRFSLCLPRSLRRVLLLPTGTRRAPRKAATPVIPPKPEYAPFVPSSAEVHDLLMRRIIAPRGTVTGRRAIAPPATVARVSKRTMNDISMRILEGSLMPGYASVQVSPTTYQAPAVPGLSVVLTGTDTLVRQDEPDDDDLLITDEWDEIFSAAIKRTDVVEFTIGSDGAFAATIHDDTIEMGTVVTDPPQAAHLCKACGQLHPGDDLGDRRWRCGGCRDISIY